MDGTDAEIVCSVMLERKKTALANYERRFDMTTAALNGLVWAESPSVIEARCQAFLPAEDPTAPV